MSYSYPYPYTAQQFRPYNPYQAPQPAQYQNIQQQPNPVQPMQPIGNFICRPVASEEEARAIPTDFSGATQVLMDQAHGMVYTKALNPMDGTAVFQAYRLVPPVPAPPLPGQMEFATVEMVQSLQSELAELKRLLEIDTGGG